MGVLRSPTDTVIVTICLPRWEKEWIKGYHSINFSGLVQEVVVEMMRQHDPKYYEENKQYLEGRTVERREAIVTVVKKYPAIVPII